jgi:amino acid adenylation domain-containing protein
MKLLMCDIKDASVSFFDLGGNSLLANDFVAEFYRMSGIELAVQKLFQFPTLEALASYLSKDENSKPFYEKIKERVATRSRGRQDDSPLAGKVAVIGMAARFPGAESIDELWRNLCAGVETVTFFDKREIDPAVDPEDARNPHYVCARGMIAGPELFDAAFFNVPPLEAVILDPQQRIFLELCVHALENAGFQSSSYNGLVGVYAGMGNNHYFPLNVAANPELLKLVGEVKAEIGREKDHIATLVSYKLNLTGPSVSVHTACSTSLVAVDQAYHSLVSGQCDLALAGGVEVRTPQMSGQVFEPGGIFTEDGHCRPFDDKATGTMFSDGAGVVILKRLEDALAEGDTIHAVIIGSAVNHDGHDKASYLAPSVRGQAEVIALAQARAAAHPDSIGYIEAHGTATPVGDPIEVEALQTVFAGQTERKQFCGIGSIKSNMGHPTTAAGIAGFIKAALAVKHGKIPPTLHYENPNPAINFADSPFYVVDRLIDWPSGTTPRRAGVSSFGYCGTNAHVIVEEPPKVQGTPVGRRYGVMLLSAKTASALDMMTKNFQHYLSSVQKEQLADVSYTLQCGRQPYDWRRFLSYGSDETAVQKLQQPNPGMSGTGYVQVEGRDVVFLFPGQGSQYFGMGRALYQHEAVFRKAVDRCAEVVLREMGFDLREKVLGAGAAGTERLVDTRITQPALFTVEYALAQLWLSYGITPFCMIGHSVGEFVAATLAGVFTLEDGLRLVSQRARLMSEVAPGAMLSVRASAEKIAAMLPAALAIAAINAPLSCVVSGETAALENFKKTLEKEGIQCKALATSHAFHSAMMDPAVAKFRDFLAGIALHAPERPIVSTVTGSFLTAQEAQNPDYWALHMRRTVDFNAAITRIWTENPLAVMLEVGPGTSSSILARQCAADPASVLTISSMGHEVEGEEELALLMSAIGQLWCAGISIDWQRFYEDERRLKVELPPYPFERKRFWSEPTHALYRHQPGRSSSPAASQHPLIGAEQATGASFQKTGFSSTQEHIIRLVHEISGIGTGRLRPEASFFALGIDSLLLSQLAFLIKRDFACEVTFRQLTTELPSIALVSSFLEKSLNPAPENTEAPTQVPPEGAAATAVSGYQVPTTSAQQEIWISSMMGVEASLAYVESMAIRLRGAVDYDRLAAALQQLVDRHDALRSWFEQDGQIMSVAHEGAVRVAVEIEDLGFHDEAVRDAIVAGMIEAESKKPFDLSRPPLFRAKIIECEELEHIVIISAHHIVCDGWSLDVLLKDLGRIYAGEKLGLARDQFADYAKAKVEFSHSPQYLMAEKYWTSRFSPVPPPLELPTERPRPARRSYDAGYVRIEVDAATARSLRRLSSELDQSLFSLLLGAYYCYIRRISGQDTLVIGVPAAGQPYDNRLELVGHCASLLPILACVDAGQTFADFAAELKGHLLDAFENQYCTYGDIVKKINPPRDPSRMPLMSLGFTHTKKYRRDQLDFGGLDVDYAINPRSYEAFEIYLNVCEDEHNLWFRCQYNSNLFDQAAIERHLGGLASLLAEVAHNAHLPIQAYHMLPHEEREKILYTWNNTQKRYAADSCVHHLIEKSVERYASSVALVFENSSMTYADLNYRASILATRLVREGLRPGGLVGICMQRCCEMVVALLAIHKAGGAYVPLDPSYPLDRLQDMTHQAELQYIVYHKHAPQLDTSHVKVVIDMDQLGNERPDPRILPSPDELSSSHLAYVIFTSGSTGRPKGVQISHRAAVNFIQSMAREPGISARDIMLAVTTLSFDISVLELIVPLTVGGKVILAASQDVFDGTKLNRLIERHGVTVMQATPATYRVLLAAGWSGSAELKILCGGEALPKDLAKKLLRRCRELWNMYGPTETTVWSTCCRILPPGEKIDIGKPIANTQIYILNDQMLPQPVGVSGEIYIGGDGVAEGYLARPDLTSERFLPNPFDPNLGKIYKTGDMGRFLGDGAIECLGRNDRQIKFRGYRIELGEIEAILASYPHIESAVVLLAGQKDQEKNLVAYLMAGRSVMQELDSLRAFIATKLPSYMVPQYFIEVKSWPRLPNGKINAAALPLPGENGLSLPRETVATSRDEKSVEHKIVAIFRQILGAKDVGPHDDFFKLGGHSLSASKLITAINDELGTRIPLHRIFEAPTVAELASLADQYPSGYVDDSMQVASGTVYDTSSNMELSEGQKLIWFFDRYGPPEAPLINLLMEGLYFKGQLDMEMLRRSIEEIVRKYTVLRSYFVESGYYVFQRFVEELSVVIDYKDLTALPAEERMGALQSMMGADAHTPIDIHKAPLFRFKAYKLTEDRFAVTFIFHHLIWDGYSFINFFDEIAANYNTLKQGRPLVKSKPEIQYIDYAKWYSQWLEGEEAERRMKFWRNKLAGTFNENFVPSDVPHPLNRFYQGSGLDFQYDQHKTALLEQLASRSGASLFMVLIAVITKAVHEATGNNEVAVLTTTASRMLPEFEKPPGLFAHFSAIRTDMSRKMDFDELLQTVKANCYEVYAHQDLPIGKLMTAVKTPRVGGHKIMKSLIFPILFTFQDRMASSLDLDGIETEELFMRNETAEADITFWIHKGKNGLVGCVNYRNDIYTAATMKRVLFDPIVACLDSLIDKEQEEKPRLTAN